MRVNNLSLGPFFIAHGSAFFVGRGNGLDLPGSHAIESLPISLAFERHQAAICFLLIKLAVNQDGACLNLFHSAVAPVCSAIGRHG